MSIGAYPADSSLVLGKGKGVLLVSGGPDSATLAYWAQEFGYEICAVHFKQGLKTDRSEMVAADALSKTLGIPFEVFDISQIIGVLGGRRAMIHSEVAALRFGTAMCLAPAIIYANIWGADHVLLALHADDTREGPEYQRVSLDPIEQAAQIATGNPRLRVVTPFLNLPKSEVIKLGRKLCVPYELTWSCINGADVHCGVCGACRARQRAFQSAGVPDQTVYREAAFATSAT